MNESDDITNLAAAIDNIDSHYKMFSDALATAANNEQRFELKNMIESYIIKTKNLTDELKELLINTLHNSLPDENGGGKKHKKSRKTKKPKKSRKTRKNN